MKWPPKREGACTTHAPDDPQKPQLAQNNSGVVIVQPVCGSAIVWKRWQREAARLFSLFWKTNDERHLLAFTTHICAMRVHEGRRRS
jgi:hypothetical protein